MVNPGSGVCWHRRSLIAPNRLGIQVRRHSAMGALTRTTGLAGQFGEGGTRRNCCTRALNRAHDTETSHPLVGVETRL